MAISPGEEKRSNTMSLHLGNWQLDSVNGGLFRLDGGVMFGVVPQHIWKHVAMPDSHNRILCANHCVLARDGKHTVLVDTGYGGKHALLDRKFYDMQPGEPLAVGLAELGVAAEAIDYVVFSHLHFDHVGGSMRHDAAKRSPHPLATGWTLSAGCSLVGRPSLS